MKSRQIRVLALTVLSLTTCFLTVFSPMAVIAEEAVAPNPLDEACVQDLLGDGWQRDKNIVLWEPGDLERLDPGRGSREIARLTVEACNVNGWTIPFPQLVLHQG